MHTIHFSTIAQFGTAVRNGGGDTAERKPVSRLSNTQKCAQRLRLVQGRTKASMDSMVTPVGPKAGWDEALKVWHDFVSGRSKVSTRAANTHWSELQLIASEYGIESPCEVTSQLVGEFISRMVANDLSAAVVNVRLLTIRSIFKVLIASGVVNSNPATDVRGPRVSASAKQMAKPLAFNESDLTQFFSSPLFNEQQLRAGRHIGEASYWIPILQFYTGARAEELAILTLSDIVMVSEFGGYFKLGGPACSDVDPLAVSGRSWARPSKGMGPNIKMRKGESIASTRRVPMATQLVELGFGRYLDWRREQGHELLFPELSTDVSGRSTGAMSKFFKRYKEDILGFDNQGQVLQCLRLSIRFAMWRASTPMQYVRCILGLVPETSMTNMKFGHPELSLAALAEQFKRIEFPSISAHPWTPGKGVFSRSNPNEVSE